ncbi:MAG: adenine phosphoribosyltransferase [Burkholderiales bacterium]|jgi:adenine phosphoribosyltransferase|nr:adenine phosphoribosyltransferase [Burkholderiales bacterium]
MTILQQDLDLIRNSIRVIPDWPEKGVSFRDITTLLQDPLAFHKVIEILLNRYKNKQIDVVAGLDARGFIFGPVLAYELGVGFVPIRKKGKLPFNTYAESYTLEYGDVTTVEIHTDAFNPGENVLIIDDLIATGGTMLASCKLINRLGGKVHECAVVNDLIYLGGSEAIRNEGFSVFSILEYK